MSDAYKTVCDWLNEEREELRTFKALGVGDASVVNRICGKIDALEKVCELFEEPSEPPDPHTEPTE
jgi:hypothetical protein